MCGVNMIYIHSWSRKKIHLVKLRKPIKTACGSKICAVKHSRIKTITESHLIRLVAKNNDILLLSCSHNQSIKVTYKNKN